MIIPQPASLELQEGAWQLPPLVPLTWAGGPEAERVAALLAQCMRARFGIECSLDSAQQPPAGQQQECEQAAQQARSGDSGGCSGGCSGGTSGGVVLRLEPELPRALAALLHQQQAQRGGTSSGGDSDVGGAQQEGKGGEGYVLTVSVAGGAVIVAPGVRGLLHGVQSLLQLVAAVPQQEGARNGGGGGWCVPALQVGAPGGEGVMGERDSRPIH